MSLVNKKELSDIFGKTQQTLTTWQKNGLPIFAEGSNGQSHQYKTEDCIQWLINREISKLTIDAEGRVHDYEAERARLTHHQANKTALEEDVLRKRLLDSEDVERVWSDVVSAFRAKMLSLPTKTASRLTNETDIAVIETVLREQVYEALSELSEYDPDDYGARGVEDNQSEGGATA